MSVAIISMASMADMMQGDKVRERIIGAILANRKILASNEQNQTMLDGILANVDEKLVGDELFRQVGRFLGSGVNLGISIEDDKEAREVLSEAGIT